MGVLKQLFRTKPIDSMGAHSELYRCLTAFDLTLLGIGAIIGAGIFVLTGIAAATKAGPAISLSYALAALACGLSALSYAELAASIGGCGSAYGYALAGIGELLAWIIGWDLLLEYGLSCSTVAIGWAGYVKNAFTAVGLHIPILISQGPFQGGIINLPASLIVLVITFILCVGVHQSARFNKIIVAIKMSAIALFIAVAAFHFDIKNWHPFLPFGWQGVVNGAAFIFFAYIGFDAVSTAAEEAINPQRDLPIGIIASLVICTLLYMIISGLLTGIVPYTTLNVSSPVAHALLLLGYRVIAAIIALGAIAGLTTVILVMYYGFTRVFLAIARDGLLTPQLAVVHPKTQTPVRIIVLAGLIMAAIAGLVPINHIAELVNIGTLAAFAVVCLGVIIMRYTRPELPRPFKTPLSPFVPTIGILLCFYLMVSLSAITWWGFLIWTLIGLVIYFGYGRSHSVLAK